MVCFVNSDFFKGNNYVTYRSNILGPQDTIFSLIRSAKPYPTLTHHFIFLPIRALTCQDSELTEIEHGLSRMCYFTVRGDR